MNRVISGGRTENVAIYSDIAAAKEETFAEAYGGLDIAGTIKVVESGDFFPVPSMQLPQPSSGRDSLFRNAGSGCHHGCARIKVSILEPRRTRSRG